MSETKNKSLSAFFNYLWPVQTHELSKLLPMVIMLSFVAFDYSILRNLKDALVITERGSGAEILPFIKLWVMFPSAILATMLFSYLLNRFPRTTVFNILFLGFSSFFLFFVFFVYPNREAFHPTASADWLQSVLPIGFKGFIAMYRNWTLTCFYVIAELWGTIVLQVLIWGFANEVTTTSEAPRFYGIMVLVSNIATICAGQAANLLKPSIHTSLSATSQWEHSLIRLVVLIVSLGLCALLAFHWMNAKVLSKANTLPQENEKKESKKKQKLSFKESISYLLRSRYLLCIASIVISYNLIFNLVEIIWKDRLRLYCPSPNEFNTYLNNLTSIMGLISSLASIGMASVIYRIGWTRTALITPSILLLTSSMFFMSLFGGPAILPLAVFFGSMQNCMTKAAKFSVFDATKEMAFIPLSSEHKMKGKAAIDGIGSRMAKSGSAVIYQFLFLLFGTPSACAPYVALIVFGLTGLWFLATLTLGKEYAQRTEEPAVEQEPAPIAAS